MATNERYTTHSKVNGLLRLPTAFTSSTVPTIKQVENLIESKMDVIDFELQTSFHLSNNRLEYRNVSPAWEEYDGLKVILNREWIVTPMATANGDSLQVWNGSSWTEYVGTKTEGRANDFWIDEERGILYLKNYSGVSNLGLKITYRFNEGARTQLNDTDGLTNSETGTVTVDSTVGFPQQGWFRIDDEEIRYNGRTSTALTSVERGAFGTTAATHSDDAVIFWCPKDIEELCTKLVAIDLLTTEDWSTAGMFSGEMGSAQLNIQGKISQWQKDVDAIYSRRRKPFTINR